MLQSITNKGARTVLRRPFFAPSPFVSYFFSSSVLRSGVCWSSTLPEESGKSSPEQQLNVVVEEAAAAGEMGEVRTQRENVDHFKVLRMSVLTFNALRRMHIAEIDVERKNQIALQAWRTIRGVSEDDVTLLSNRDVVLALTSWCYFAKIWENGMDGPANPLGEREYRKDIEVYIDCTANSLSEPLFGSEEEEEFGNNTVSNNGQSDDTDVVYDEFLRRDGDTEFEDEEEQQRIYGNKKSNLFDSMLEKGNKGNEQKGGALDRKRIEKIRNQKKMQTKKYNPREDASEKPREDVLDVVFE